MLIFLIVVLAAGIGLWSFASIFIIRGVEEPRYMVLSWCEGYEIREYESHLVAEIEIGGTLDEASNEGFSVLSGYIFGVNASKSTIAMTVPVVADTGGDQHTIIFSIPSKYTLSTLPVPDDKRIVFREVPARRMAALRFGWYATEVRVSMMEERLLSMLERDGIDPAGEPELARYNPPFTMPFLLKNEVLVELR